MFAMGQYIIYTIGCLEDSNFRNLKTFP